MKRSPNPVDKHVGSRVRMRRLLLGLSQEKLGEALGLTFQQVQKYEKGTNRIGASRLQQISKILQAPPSYFFDGAPVGNAPGEMIAQAGFSEAPPLDTVTEFVTTAEGLQLNRAFARITQQKIRRKIIDLVTVIADAEDSANETSSGTSLNI
ncbi:MAG: helix-turn-helix transcriptional regulator [Alphaproteobacteria bacterium]|nr:helix-turn-helix transcriptional regulator [Alphaproteobacteria bacterium]